MRILQLAHTIRKVHSVEHWLLIGRKKQLKAGKNFVDYLKALDTLNHRLFLAKTKAYGRKV